MNNLGSMYERGTGVAKDLDDAQKWYERAAELGNDDALANVEPVSYTHLPAVELPEDLRRRAEAPLLRMLEQSQS